jgi:hypothetical protein
MAVKRWNVSNGTWEAFGSPQLNPASLGISPATIGAVNVTNGAVSTASTSLSVVRNITVSTSAPTSGQGSDGDIWVQYV